MKGSDRGVTCVCVFVWYLQLLRSTFSSSSSSFLLLRCHVAAECSRPLLDTKCKHGVYWLVVYNRTITDSNDAVTCLFVPVMLLQTFERWQLNYSHKHKSEIRFWISIELIKCDRDVRTTEERRRSSLVTSGHLSLDSSSQQALRLHMCRGAACSSGSSVMSVFMDLNLSFTADKKLLQSVVETAAHRESPQLSAAAASSATRS